MPPILCVARTRREVHDGGSPLQKRPCLRGRDFPVHSPCFPLQRKAGQDSRSPRAGRDGEKRHPVHRRRHGIRAGQGCRNVRHGTARHPFVRELSVPGIGEHRQRGRKRDRFGRRRDGHGHGGESRKQGHQHGVARRWGPAGNRARAIPDIREEHGPGHDDHRHTCYAGRFRCARAGPLQLFRHRSRLSQRFEAERADGGSAIPDGGCSQIRRVYRSGGSRRSSCATRPTGSADSRTCRK
jgi:hypothetical protein